MAIAIVSAANGYTASTYSFTTVENRGSHPRTVTFSNPTLSVDISSIPKGAAVYRAILVPHRKGNTFDYRWRGSQNETIKIEPWNQKGTYLSLRPPDYLTFDATQAVQKAVSDGSDVMVFNVVNFPKFGTNDFAAQYTDNATENVVIRLDITTDLPLDQHIDQVDNIAVNHRNGSTMVTWSDPEPLAGSDHLPWETFTRIREGTDNPREIRYRIYRHTAPITSKNIGRAVLLGETDAMSVWNWQYFKHGIKPGSKAASADSVPRFPIADEVLAGYDMGLFVHASETTLEKAYFAVSRTIDGMEDLSFIPHKNATQSPVRIFKGSGMVLLWKEIKTENWNYVPGETTLQYYVKWESPPNFNSPEPFNYLVAIPQHQTLDTRRPLSIGLHSWGQWLNQGFGSPVYSATKGAIHVSTNQFPYDWWTGYHENFWTLKPLDNLSGSIIPFTQRRIKSFVDDFVIPRWHIDTSRIFLYGNSMGGSGVSLWGVRQGDYFAGLLSMVGVHIPSQTPGFIKSFERVYGAEKDSMPFEKTGLSVWDYMDNSQWLKNNMTADTPHISFSNGKNDDAIGWPQAWKFVKTLIETKRPFTFKWGMRGHLESPVYMGDMIDFQSSRSLPAFSGGSLDDHIGDAPYDSDDSGRINYYYLWETDSIVDETDKWEITLYLRDSAPSQKAVVHVTPRNLKRFKPRAGTSYDWENIEKGKTVQKGRQTADKNGLITIESLRITKDGNRIKIF